MTEQTRAIAWHEIVVATLKATTSSSIVYVPDRVFTPLIKAIHADPFFTAFTATREEEALGIVSGAWMGGMRGAVLMQTSGFATIPNALASLVVPCQIPALIFVSERGTLGEFNLGQALVCKTMRPVLNSLGGREPHHHAPGRTRLHRRPLHQAGGGDAGAGRLSSSRRCSPAAKCSKGDVMTAKPSGAVGAHNAKVMNRFELTKRLVGQLKRDEAVIGGIGNANFDLWASGQRPQNFYMLGSMGLTIPIALGVAIAQPQRHVVALEGDGSLLMQLGCLATVADAGAEKSHDRRVGQRHLSDHRRPADGERDSRRSGRHRAWRRPRQQRLGGGRRRLRSSVRCRRSKTAGRA